MDDLGPVIAIVGFALLLVPLADLLGPLGYFLIGGSLVLTGSVLSLRSGGDGRAAGPGPSPNNCPNCGAPNDDDATACRHCEASLA